MQGITHVYLLSLKLQGLVDETNLFQQLHFKSLQNHLVFIFIPLKKRTSLNKSPGSLGRTTNHYNHLKIIYPTTEDKSLVTNKLDTNSIKPRHKGQETPFRLTITLILSEFFLEGNYITKATNKTPPPSREPN